MLQADLAMDIAHHKPVEEASLADLKRRHPLWEKFASSIPLSVPQILQLKRERIQLRWKGVTGTLKRAAQSNHMFHEGTKLSTVQCSQCEWRTSVSKLATGHAQYTFHYNLIHRAEPIVYPCDCCNPRGLFLTTNARGANERVKKVEKSGETRVLGTSVSVSDWIRYISGELELVDSVVRNERGGAPTIQRELVPRRGSSKDSLATFSEEEARDTTRMGRVKDFSRKTLSQPGSVEPESRNQFGRHVFESEVPRAQDRGERMAALEHALNCSPLPGRHVSPSSSTAGANPRTSTIE